MFLSGTSRTPRPPSRSDQVLFRILLHGGPPPDELTLPQLCTGSDALTSLEVRYITLALLVPLPLVVRVAGPRLEP